VEQHPAEPITRFAECVGRENVIAATDCGFAQEELNRRVHPTVMWAKLEAIAEGARLATQQFW
jgi:5-methyltetrahydropteroyltriglutamate--homocysteine methyltransferase